MLGESAGFGTPNNRSWRRSEDGNVYIQCVTAVYALARDPFPRVACLGRQVLRIMGVESSQIMLAAKAGANRPGGHQRNSSVPALPPTPSIAGILHRSTSWVASTSGGYIFYMVTVIGLSLVTRFLLAFPQQDRELGHIQHSVRRLTS